MKIFVQKTSFAKSPRLSPIILKPNLDQSLMKEQVDEKQNPNVWKKIE